MYEKALKLARKAHDGQEDKGGQPYIYHLITVSDGVEGEIEKVVALLHDIVEDTDYTLEKLKTQGFSDEVVSAIDCLTKRKNEIYEDYLRRVSSNVHSTRVKIADLKHNMDTERLEKITEKDLKRIEKYKFATDYLSCLIEE